MIQGVMKKSYEQKVLANWESIYQQGLLTFWIFIALKDQKLVVGELKERVSELTNGTYNTSEQSLYRSLRKFYELELVNYEELENDLGPKRKLYSLSDTGLEILKEFSNRNIKLFLQPEVQDLIRKEKD